MGMGVPEKKTFVQTKIIKLTNILHHFVPCLIAKIVKELQQRVKRLFLLMPNLLHFWHSFIYPFILFVQEDRDSRKKYRDLVVC